jgi:RyR domain/TrkA-N domain
MRRTYANFWSQAAAGLTALSHTRASVFRWVVFILLAVVWIWSGLAAWGNRGILEAIYRTISAIGMYDDYFNANNDMIQVARFAGITVPVIGLLFAFSGALGRSLAQAFNLGAAHHVVIAGASPPALSLALDCRLRAHDAVILIGRGLAEETALGLRRRGVIVIEGEATRVDTLIAARAHHAAHVVAFEEEDAANLQIEAAVRRLVGDGRRKPPIGMHVATRSAILLREAREMRSQQNRRRGASEKPEAVDSKPFSLNETIGRALVQNEAQTLLDLAELQKHERVHIIFFGFDEAAEAFAVRTLMTLWSVRFEAPRLTVLIDNPESAETRFRARYGEAFAHPDLWAADIVFRKFDREHETVSSTVLEAVEAARGKPTAAVVASGSDPDNIHMSIALMRVCNRGFRWPVPIFMRESSISEFSLEYAKGDTTEELDAYLQAFGAHQYAATRARILDGAIDRGAAVAHEYYNKHLGDRGAMNMRELQAAMKNWADVLETYRAANRAVADSAMVKLWDAGWRPAKEGEKGDTAPSIPEDKLEPMARREHDRWVAERLLSGWRPAEKRDNDMLHHDKLVGWDKLSEDDRDRDVVQVRASIDVARILHPKGFVQRA